MTSTSPDNSGPEQPQRHQELSGGRELSRPYSSVIELLKRVSEGCESLLAAVVCSDAEPAET